MDTSTYHGHAVPDKGPWPPTLDLAPSSPARVIAAVRGHLLRICIAKGAECLSHFVEDSVSK